MRRIQTSLGFLLCPNLLQSINLICKASNASMSSRSLRSPERKRLAIEGRESRKAKEEREERGLIPTSALEEEIGQRQRKRKSRCVFA